jgi:hypothetical protein
MLLFLAVTMESVGAQQTQDVYSRKNTFSLFAEYSNTSSHIFLGISRQRELADAGGAYARRLFQFKGTSFQYLAEVRPVTFESDPVTTENGTTTVTSGPGAGTSLTYTLTGTYGGKCRNETLAGSFSAGPQGSAGTYVEVFTCSRQWTFAQEFSPVGFRYSIRTRQTIQPFIVSTVGYMYSNRPIPLSTAGSFNFQFDFGAGIEVFRTKSRSMSFEARLHHFSNKNTAADNPGVDNLNYKVSYNFGR